MVLKTVTTRLLKQQNSSDAAIFYDQPRSLPIIFGSTQKLYVLSVSQST